MRLGPDDLVLSSGIVGNPPLPELVEAAVAGGFAGVTLWPGSYHGAADADRILGDAGLVVQDLDAAVAWVGPDDPGAPYFEEAPLPVVLEVADAVGAENVNVLLAGPGGTVEEAAAVFGELADQAARHGMGTVLEFSRNRFTPDVRSATAVVEAAGRPRTGLCVDLWHVHHGPGDFTDLEEVAPELIRTVQVSDVPADEPDDLGWATRYARLAPGAGVLDLPGILALLRRIGAPAPLSVEAFDDARLAEIGAVPFARELGEACRAVQRAAASG